MTRPVRVVGLVLMLYAALSVAMAGPAAAHAELIRTTPADGQRLDRAPAQVVLEFAERVSLVSEGVRLFDAAGGEVATPEPHAMGQRVMLPMPADLPRGGYVLSWRVASGDDHPVSGAFTFGVGADPVGAAAVDKAGTAVTVAVAMCRWLAFAGTALLVGGLVFLLVCWPEGRASRRARGPEGRASRRAHGLVMAGWGAAAAATGLALLVHGPYVSARPLTAALDPRLLGDTLATRFGLAYLARLALLCAVLLPMRRLLRPGPGPGWVAYGAVAVAGLGLAATHAGTGHAAAGRGSALAMAADGVHLLVMSVWAGGLVVLGACVLRPRATPAVRSALPRFSRLAVGSVALLAGTGTLQAWREVGSWSGFVGTAYGRLVLAKLAVFGGVLALGGLAWLAVRRARDPARRLRRIVPLELLGVAAILGVTAVLVTATPPGRPVRAAVEAGPTQVTLPVPDGGTAELRLLPATVGQNDVHIAVLDVAGHPRAVTEARLRVGLDSRDLGPFDISLRSHGTGLFGGRIALPYPGDWRVNLVVRTTDVDTYALSTTVRVAAPLTR